MDTLPEALSSAALAAIRTISDKPIHFIVNTQAGEDHTGGNEALAKAGPTRPDRVPLGSGLGGNTGGATSIVAHENVLNRMSATGRPAGTARPRGAWPSDTFFEDENDIFFNDEAVQVLHQPDATGDGDSIVFFRKSDVVVAGDVFSTTSYPVFNRAQGGSINGVIAALNRIIRDHGADAQPGRRHHGRARARPPERRDGRRRIPQHADDRPRSDSGAGGRGQRRSSRCVRRSRRSTTTPATEPATGPASPDAFVAAVYESLRAGATVRPAK